MNILVINDHGIFCGGTETRVRLLLEEFIKKKIFNEIHVLQKYPDPFSNNYHKKNPRVIFHVIGNKHSAYIIARKIIKEQNIKVVQAHNLLAIKPYVLIAAKQLGIPVVWWAHDYWLVCAKRSFIDPFNAKKDQLCMSTPKKHYPRCMTLKSRIKHCIWKYIMNYCVTVALSPSCILQEIHESGHILHNKWKVIFPWVDPLFLQKESRVLKAGFSTGVFTKKKNEKFLLFVGSLIEFKGAWVAAEALKKIVKRFPHTKLLFIGSEQEPASRHRKDIEQQCMYDGTLHNILFLGKKSKEEILHIYKYIDAYICPTVCMESFGLNWAEAMGAGVPVIASAIGSIPEYVCDKETGMLFTPRDYDGLATAVIEIFSNDKLADRIRCNGVEYAQNHFGSKRAANEVMKIYNSIMKER